MTYPITPPPELVQQWRHQWWSVDPDCEGAISLQHYIATQAAQWGWDQRGATTEAELQQARDEELNACCEWLDFYSSATDARDLRTARRPKPPSLKKQALDALATIEGDFNTVGDRAETIRRALEALPND